MERVQTRDRPTRSGGLQTSLLCYLYDSCFQQYRCYQEVFRCLFQKQLAILPKFISFCKFQHAETYHHPLLLNKQRIQSNFITASECPCLKEIIGRRLFYWLKCAAFSFFSLMALCRLWSLGWWLKESGWLGNISEATLKSNSSWAPPELQIFLCWLQNKPVLHSSSIPSTWEKSHHTTMRKKSAGSNFWVDTQAFFIEPQVPCKHWICIPGKGEVHRQLQSVLGLKEWHSEDAILSFPRPVFSAYVLKMYLPTLWILLELRIRPNSCHHQQQ